MKGGSAFCGENPMKKILMLTTGGTIASLPSEEGLAPTGADTILSHMCPSAANYDITTQEILTCSHG